MTAGADTLARGLARFRAGDHAAATDLFRAASALLPADPAPALNLATALLALGDVPGARAAARKARLRAPQLAAAHYMLGMAELAACALPAAAAAFARATDLAPALVDAWINLGVVRYRQHDMAAARQAMLRALAIDPTHRAATANLAVFERLAGEAAASEARLAAALARDPGDAAARLNRAGILLADDQPAAAWALLDGPPPDALASQWRLQQVLALLLLDRAREAHSSLVALGAVPAALAPLAEQRRLLLALHTGDTAAARAHADTVRRLLVATPDVLPEHRIMGWYDLGRFRVRQGEHAAAFDAWTQGHRLLARFQPFSRAAAAAFQAATVAAFGRARLHDGPLATNRDPAPVFIVGLPRSGTTLAEQILAAHRDVHGAGERAALADRFWALAGGDDAAAVARAAALDTVALDVAAAGYLAALHALAPGKARIVDKMPGNVRLLGFAALLLPGARVILCERDPRDIGLSIFQHRFFGHHPYAHDLGDLGWYIARQRALADHWRAVLPVPPLTVRLRDWVEDFGTTLRRVLAFVGLPYDPACERFFAVERDVRTVSRRQVREPINARGIGRWRAYGAQLAPLIAELERERVSLND